MSDPLHVATRKGLFTYQRDGTSWKPQRSDFLGVPAQSDETRIPNDGKLVVTRTCDGGKSFHILTNGLPQQNAYDLIYRHALALNPKCHSLAMGSTTGNLWTSSDQGDSWSHLNAHLPPVYAVRFG